MIDAHSHIQFKIFDENRDQVILDAKKAGVEKIIAVGTNLETSKKAIEVAEKYPEVFASVGIHPHHVFEHLQARHSGLDPESHRLEILKQVQDDVGKLLRHPKVLAIGETGMDKYIYKSTKYPNYLISSEFIKLQKLFFEEQIKLAIKHKKTLIIHNREAVLETLEVLEKNWDKTLEGKSVFHMCEPDQRLLDFALKHNIFISFGGDITYDSVKQNFIKRVPLELIVLETDSPFFVPEPLKSQGVYPGTPANLILILGFMANLLELKLEKLDLITTKNSQELFWR